METSGLLFLGGANIYMTVEKWQQEFAGRLRDKMDKRGWSIRKTAKESGLSIMTISKYVNALVVPRCTELMKLANAFSVNTSYFIDFGEPVEFKDMEVIDNGI